MKTLFQVGLVLVMTLSASASFAQRANSEFKLSVMANQSELQLGEEAKVRATITWGNVPRGKVESLRVVSFRITKAAYENGVCTRGDCFEARYRFAEPVVMKSGQTFEFDVDLSELQWYDMALSGRDFTARKNIAETMTPGSYFLSMAAGFPAEYSARTSREVWTSSTFVPVQVK